VPVIFPAIGRRFIVAYTLCVIRSASWHRITSSQQKDEERKTEWTDWRCSCRWCRSTGDWAQADSAVSTSRRWRYSAPRWRPATRLRCELRAAPTGERIRTLSHTHTHTPPIHSLLAPCMHVMHMHRAHLIGFPWRNLPKKIHVSTQTKFRFFTFRHREIGVKFQTALSASNSVSRMLLSCFVNIDCPDGMNKTICYCTENAANGRTQTRTRTPVSDPYPYSNQDE